MNISAAHQTDSPVGSKDRDPGNNEWSMPSLSPSLKLMQTVSQPDVILAKRGERAYPKAPSYLKRYSLN